MPNVISYVYYLWCSVALRTKSVNLGEKGQMSKRLYREHEKKEFADAIVDAIEDRVHKGRISRHSANKWYSAMSKYLNLPDLRPRQAGVWPTDPKEFHRMMIKYGYKPQLNGGIFTPIKTKKVNYEAELKEHARLLRSIENDAQAIAEGLKKLKKRELEQLYSRHTNGQRSTDNG